MKFDIRHIVDTAMKLGAKALLKIAGKAVANFIKSIVYLIFGEIRYTIVRFAMRTTKEELVEKTRQVIQDYIFSLLVKRVQRHIFAPNVAFIQKCAAERGEQPVYFFSERCAYTEV